MPVKAGFHSRSAKIHAKTGGSGQNCCQRERRSHKEGKNQIVRILHTAKQLEFMVKN